MRASASARQAFTNPVRSGRKQRYVNLPGRRGPAGPELEGCQGLMARINSRCATHFFAVLAFTFPLLSLHFSSTLPHHLSYLSGTFFAALPMLANRR